MTSQDSAGPVPDEDGPVVRLSPAQLDYLLGERRLGRLATADATGRPHVVPVGWSYNKDLGTIDISGRNFAATRKYRNVQDNPRAAFVVDDVLPPWRPRSVMVQGTAQALAPTRCRRDRGDDQDRPEKDHLLGAGQRPDSQRVLTPASAARTSTPASAEAATCTSLACPTTEAKPR